jgi:hypothetical protein
MLHLPYSLDMLEYAIQGASFGTTSRLPIIGHDGGPGGKGNPLRLLWSRNTTIGQRKRARTRQSKALMGRNMTRLGVCGGRMRLGVDGYKGTSVLISRDGRDASHRGRPTGFDKLLSKFVCRLDPERHRLVKTFLLQIWDVSNGPISVVTS